MLKVRHQPLSGKTTKITNHCSPSFFHSSFFPAFGINSLTLINPILPSRPSKQMFTTSSYRPPIQILNLFYPRLSTPNPPPSNSLLSFLKVPVMSILFTPCSPPHPSPFHRSPNVSVPHCFVLPSSAPLVSCPPCCALCVCSHSSLNIVYKK